MCLVPCTGHGLGEAGDVEVGTTGAVTIVFSLGLGLATVFGIGMGMGFFNTGLGGIISVFGREKTAVSAL